MNWEQWKTYDWNARYSLSVRGLARLTGWTVAEATTQSALCLLKHNLGRW